MTLAQADLVKLATSSEIDLSEHCIANVLFALSLQKATGLATFQTDKVVRKVVFNQGIPITASSNLRSENASNRYFSSLEKIF